MYEPGSSSAATTHTVPESLSGHKILGEIGQGGMGSVWLAQDERLNRRVAIKTLHPEFLKDSIVRERFMQEARALAMVNHPNVVRIYELGGDEEVPHFVMEYVQGAPLVDAAHQLTVHQKVEILRKICLAVESLHQHGIVHRDLKPTNVLVGPDLEPKLLDFGLARLLANSRLSSSGVAVGTPQYFSPEQTVAGGVVDERSDIFALGILFYELLTGTLPFRGDSLAEQANSTCQADPELPRRLNNGVPGELQNICLKALEKRRSDRYSSALDMAQDLERFLAGEPVMAQPTAFQRMISGRIEQHLQDIQSWRADEVITQHEFDHLRKAYASLTESEDAWIMEFRRLTLPQVTLYMGSWIVVIASALILLFQYKQLSPFASLAVSVLACIPAAHTGLKLNRSGDRRISIAYLLAFCLMLPLTLLLATDAFHLWTGLTQGKESLEFLLQFKTFKPITNAQVWWAILLALPAYVVVRRYTKASVFSLVMAFMISNLGMVTLLRLGLLEWKRDTAFLRILPIAAVLFVIAFALEHWRKQSDSRYFYPFAVLFTFIALSGYAAEPEHKVLASLIPVTRGAPEYFFIINAGIYYALQYLCDLVKTPQMRNVAKVFRFVIPGHVMTSVLILGFQATQRWESNPAVVALRIEARVFEVALPVLACLFVFLSLPKQMKNYLASGLVFLAIGLVRLQQNMLKDVASWPLALIVTGFCLMIVAVKYPAIHLTLWSRKQA